VNYFQHIPVNEIKLGYTYKLSARNFLYGVAVKSSYGFIEFIGIRTKFQSTYLFEEIHWDEDPDFGTAKPLEEIEKCPIENIHRDSPELFSYLERLENEYRI
jgi:hypothetical protein